MRAVPRGHGCRDLRGMHRTSSKRSKIHKDLYVSPAAARDAGARPRRIDMDPLSGGRPDVRRRPIEGVDSSSNKAFVKRASPGVWGVDTSESPSSKNAWKSRWPSGAAKDDL